MNFLASDFCYKVVCTFPDLGEFVFLCSDYDSLIDVLAFHSDCSSVRVYDCISGHLLESIDGFASIDDLKAHTG